MGWLRLEAVLKPYKKSVRRSARHTWKEICHRMVVVPRPWVRKTNPKSPQA